MMPTNVAARMTLAADPGSLQGAVAAGILGAARSSSAPPSSARGCSRMRRRRRGVDAAEVEIARRSTRPAGRCPGFGHPVHQPVDPRAERILELADERGVSGPHVALARAPP